MKTLIIAFTSSLFIGNFAAQTSKLQISSSAFKNSESIPNVFSCDGKNINPPLEISGIPANTKSLILIMDDPDAPTKPFIHWLLYIPVQKDKIIISENSIPQNSISGKNSAQTLKYFGPCPPNGLHHYYFKVYALDIPLSLSQGFSKEEMEQQINGHVIARAIYMGTFQK